MKNNKNQWKSNETLTKANENQVKNDKAPMCTASRSARGDQQVLTTASAGRPLYSSRYMRSEIIPDILNRTTYLFRVRVGQEEEEGDGH